jgi:hypothetical protein
MPKGWGKLAPHEGRHAESTAACFLRPTSLQLLGLRHKRRAATQEHRPEVQLSTGPPCRKRGTAKTCCAHLPLHGPRESQRPAQPGQQHQGRSADLLHINERRTCVAVALPSKLRATAGHPRGQETTTTMPGPSVCRSSSDAWPWRPFHQHGCGSPSIPTRLIIALRIHCPRCGRVGKLHGPRPQELLLRPSMPCSIRPAAGPDGTASGRCQAASTNSPAWQVRRIGQIAQLPSQAATLHGGRDWKLSGVVAMLASQPPRSPRAGSAARAPAPPASGLPGRAAFSRAR